MRWKHAHAVGFSHTFVSRVHDVVCARERERASVPSSVFSALSLSLVFALWARSECYAEWFRMAITLTAHSGFHSNSSLHSALKSVSQMHACICCLCSVSPFVSFAFAWPLPLSVTLLCPSERALSVCLKAENNSNNEVAFNGLYAHIRTPTFV